MSPLEVTAVRGHVAESIIALSDEKDDDLREALVHLVAASSALRFYAERHQDEVVS